MDADGVLLENEVERWARAGCKGQSERQRVGCRRGEVGVYNQQGRACAKALRLG